MRQLATHELQESQGVLCARTRGGFRLAATRFGVTNHVHLLLIELQRFLGLLGASRGSFLKRRGAQRSIGGRLVRIPNGEARNAGIDIGGKLPTGALMIGANGSFAEIQAARPIDRIVQGLGLERAKRG